jgi:hypothetical protein
LAETCSSQKLSDLLEGLGGWNGTDNLFLLRSKPALPLGQVKDEVFDGSLANLGLFSRNFVSCLT